MKTVSSDSGQMLKIGFGRINRGTFFRVLCTLLLAATVGFAGPVKPGGQREVKTIHGQSLHRVRLDGGYDR